MTFDDMDETARQFLKCLFEQTEGQSYRPKTTIIREGLRSLEGVLKQFAGNRSLAGVRALIGD